jgi:virginiamycin A acetyltransferase
MQKNQSADIQTLRYKHFMKKLGLFISIFITGPLILFTWVGSKVGSDQIFRVMAQSLSLIPGQSGIYLRRAYYLFTLDQSSSDFSIDFGSFFSKRDAKIGHNCSIGAFCIIGKVTIGNNVRIASRVSLLSGKYQHGDAKSFDAVNDQLLYTRIHIGNNTWIGEGAIIAADLGNNCVAAAGTVVLRNVPDKYMIAGNPMKIMKIAEQDQ